MKPVYVISGFMRSGTSMMMKALEAGGMEACYRQSRDEMKNRFADEHYDPNIGGLYELERKDYLKPDFPRGYEGKLIKALQLGPGRMKVMPGGIKVVFMRRDAEEQRQSYDAFFGQDAYTAKGIEERVKDSLDAIYNRRDTTCLELWYANVIEHPRESMERVQTFFGADLDIDAAVSVVDPQYYRFRLDELEVGIV